MKRGTGDSSGGKQPHLGMMVVDGNIIQQLALVSDISVYSSTNRSIT